MKGGGGGVVGVKKVVKVGSGRQEKEREGVEVREARGGEEGKEGEPWSREEEGGSKGVGRQRGGSACRHAWLRRVDTVKGTKVEVYIFD